MSSTLIAITLLILAQVALQSADAYTTYKSLKYAGAKERNKALLFFQSLITNLTTAKWAWLVVPKILVLVVLCVVAVMVVGSGYEMAFIVSQVALCLFYAWAVKNNLKLYKRRKKTPASKSKSKGGR